MWGSCVQRFLSLLNCLISSTSHLIGNLFFFSERGVVIICHNLSAIKFKIHIKQPVYHGESTKVRSQKLWDCNNKMLYIKLVISLISAGRARGSESMALLNLLHRLPSGGHEVRSTLFESKPLIRCSASLKALTILRLNSCPDIMPKEEDAQENTSGLCKVAKNMQRYWPVI